MWKPVSLAFFAAFLSLAACDLTSVTSTQTIYASTTAANSGECNNFNGACVIYNGAATTTIYAGNSPSSIYTPTTTTSYASRNPTSTTTIIVQTTTVSNANACNNYAGSCVVYGSNGAATTIVNGASNSNGPTNGNANADGVIGAQATGGNQNGGGAGGAIGSAVGLRTWSTGSLMAAVLAGIALVRR